MLRNLLVATLFMSAAKGIIRAQCVSPEWFPKTETFSAIADIQGQGPAGSELHLEDQGKRVAATLRGYRGKAIPVVTKLQGSIEKSSRWVEDPPLARCDCQARTTEVRWKLRGRLLLFTSKEKSPDALARIGKEVLSYGLSLKRHVSNEENKVRIPRYGFRQMLQTTIHEHDREDRHRLSVPNGMDAPLKS